MKEDIFWNPIQNALSTMFYETGFRCFWSNRNARKIIFVAALEKVQRNLISTRKSCNAFSQRLRTYIKTYNFSQQEVFNNFFAQKL